MKKVTEKNLAKVMRRLEIFLDDDIERKRDFIKRFNEFLDDLNNNDLFGTEGQCDPRGDCRE